MFPATENGTSASTAGLLLFSRDYVGGGSPQSIPELRVSLGAPVNVNTPRSGTTAPARRAGIVPIPRAANRSWSTAAIVRPMSAKFVHTCIRARDIDASVAFYERLGFEHRGRLNFESAYNVYLGLPGDGDVLELTVNVGRDEPYDLGEGYNHMAVIVDDLDAMLEQLALAGIQPERAPYAPGGRDEYRICFVADPDGYRIELIDGAFPTPQDPPHPSQQTPPA